MQNLKFWRTGNAIQSSFSSVDWLVTVFILLAGAFQFTHYTKTPDFVTDPGYPDLARAILEQHSYRFDFLPETTLPPGFPMILAFFGHWGGVRPASVFPIIAVSVVVGLVAAYGLLRHVEGRSLAAFSCLLLGSYPALFGFSTSLVFPEMPFFALSMVALLLALKTDGAEQSKTPIGWIVAFSIALVWTVLIRSVGIALLMGIVSWSAASYFVDRKLGLRRLKRFIAPLILGIATQVTWSVWAARHQVLEWKLPGYPQSYVSQLKVKDGQYPELGIAKLADIPPRVGRNIVMRAAGYTQILTHRYVSKFWSSPAIFGVAALIVMGLMNSIRNGGALYDWYFIWYEVIFLVWPWDIRERFLFPVVPLAALYVWRGMRQLRDYFARKPKLVGTYFILFGSLLSLVSAAFAGRSFTFPVQTDHMRGDHLQPVAATAFWMILASVGIAMVTSNGLHSALAAAHPFGRGTDAAVRWLKAVVTVAVALAVGSGVLGQLTLGRFNLHPDIAQQAFYPEIQASEWIATHESLDRVIMARDQDTVFHYTGRRVVWFPPISDPRVVMDGIKRHRVDVLVVAHHAESYWLPPEDTCFRLLQRAYGNAFHLIHQGANYQIFEVSRSAM